MNNKNNNKKNGTGMGWGTRVAGLLFSAVFALGFGSVGITALRSLTTLLHGAWDAKSWQAVPADIVTHDLHASTDSEGSTTYAVRARYRYDWGGRTYESSHVGLPGSLGSDNFDDWHHTWDARLRAAREGGPPVSAWVDPQHPERAVLDPHLRWRQVLFMLPFAVLFPMVALGASYVACMLLVRKAPVPQASPTAQRHAPRHQALGLGLFAIVFCVMALPAVGMASNPSAPAWVAVVAGAFVVAGLGLLTAAVRAIGRAWTYRGTFASFQPAEPCAGAAFVARWTLPPRAAASWPAEASIRLRVAQYRIDDSGSGSTERLVEELSQQVRPQPDAAGGLTLQARFELPADAPSQDSRRSGEKVEWRLEWLDAKGGVMLMVPVPVHATAAHDAVDDRFSPAERTSKRDIPAAPEGDAMPALPSGVTLQEQPDALLLRFGQTGWRWLGVAALIGLAMAALRSMLWLETALLALALHALSRRWTLAVRDDGLALERVSWMWRRELGLTAASLRGLYQRWRHDQAQGGQTTAFHALWARGVDRGNDIRLTPALPGTGAAQLGQLLRWAHAHRTGRFSPGGLRTEPANRSQPRWGWLLCLLWMAARLWLPA